jgi:hypothetical protein
MTGLDDKARSRGGQNQGVKTSESWSAEFMGKLASGGRLIKHDRPEAGPGAEGAEKAAEMLMDEGRKFPWLWFGAVCADGGTVRKDIAKEQAASFIRQMGGCVGYAGMIFFNDRLVVFTRPVQAGPEALKLLEQVADKLENFGKESLKELVAAKMKGKL